MRKIIYDENGEMVDELANRNDEIIANLEDKIEEFRMEKNADLKGKSRFGFR